MIAFINEYPQILFNIITEYFILQKQKYDRKLIYDHEREHQ